jgi:hypothetical protein
LGHGEANNAGADDGMGEVRAGMPYCGGSEGGIMGERALEPEPAPAEPQNGADGC